MLEAVIKAWPIFAFFVLTTGSLLTWIGMGVWKIARWTQKHDHRMDNVEDRMDRIEYRQEATEDKVNELQVFAAKLSARL